MTTESATTEEVTTESKLSLNIVTEGKSDYTIIYKEGASTEVMRGVNSLISALKTYTGATLKSDDDFLARGAEPKEYEILIGYTNREESQQAGTTLRDGDYSISVIGKKLVICGLTNKATAEALQYFTTYFIKANSSLKADTVGSFTVSEDQNYSFLTDYAIRSLTINGHSIADYRIVIPAESYAEEYMAILLKKHLAIYSGYVLDLVTDEEAAVECEILFGKTNRSTLTAKEGNYTIGVVGNNLEVVSDSYTGYYNAYNALRSKIMPYSTRDGALEIGDQWSGAFTQAVAEKTGNLRLMYHNVWGYYDGSNPVLNRSKILIPVYEEYAPDILCLQEAGPAFRSSSPELVAFLRENYKEICYSDDGGSGNPIYYNEEILTLVDSGYKKSRSGDKGTTWAIFTEKATGKTFAVTNSHFAANTNAGGDATLGNTYRTQDAQVVVDVTDTILRDHPGITVYSGGDYNSYTGSDPISTLTNAGFTEVRTLAETAATKSPYHGTFGYDEDYDVYYLQTNLNASVTNAIDHLMTKGAESTIHCYSVVSDVFALTSSDHAPHYIDFTLGN